MRMCWILFFAVTQLPGAENTATLDGPQVERLIQDLSDDSYGVREMATERLADAPVRCLELLRAAALATQDPEVTQRLHRAAREIFILRVLPALSHLKIPGHFGIAWDVSERPPGLVLTTIVDGSSAASAGFQHGDILIQVGAWKAKAGLTEEDSLRDLRAFEFGDVLDVTFLRAGAQKSVSVTVGRMETNHPSYKTLMALRLERLLDQYMKNEIQIPPALLTEDPPTPRRRKRGKFERGETPHASVLDSSFRHHPFAGRGEHFAFGRTGGRAPDPCLGFRHLRNPRSGLSAPCCGPSGRPLATLALSGLLTIQAPVSLSSPS